MIELEKIDNEEEKAVIKEENKVIPFTAPTKIEETEKVKIEEINDEIPTVVPTKIEETEDYKRAAAIYKQETQKLDEDYDLLKYAKEYIAAYNKFNDELGKCSNLALAGVVDYINKLYAAKRSNPACEQIHGMIIDTLNTKDPKLEDDVIERYPKM